MGWRSSPTASQRPGSLETWTEDWVPRDGPGKVPALQQDMHSSHSSLRLPFCPNPNCDSQTESTTWRFKKKGFFFRQRRPFRVQRYVCQHCGRSFSSQTYSTRYWLKRPELLTPTFHRIVACSGYRQIARESGVSHSTIRRLAERIGRHCLLLHEELRPRTPPREPLVLDGFRTFEHSQFWPFDLNLLVGTSPTTSTGSMTRSSEA